jgi:hypothetical protein
MVWRFKYYKETEKASFLKAFISEASTGSARLPANDYVANVVLSAAAISS